MASTQLKRTNGSPTNDKIGTISLWLKRSNLSTDQRLVMNMVDGNNYGIFYFVSSDEIELYTVTGGSQSSQVRTTRKFRDTNAWYHIVLAIDTTQGTTTDRVKMYVNGVQETSFSQTDYFGQNESCPLLIASTTNYHTIGAAENAQANFDGLMSHVHFCDGTALAPTVFGETDSTTGEWKIKTNASFTPGNNGYTILKDGNTITDQSSNSNDFTLGAGTLTKTEDCPSNVFATLNLLAPFGGNSSPVLANGNTTLDTTASNGNKGLFLSSLGMSSGKFYCEMKPTTVTRFSAGVCNKNVFLSSSSPDSQRNQAAITYYYGGSIYYDNNGTVSGGVSLSNNDILGIALDMDNNRLFFHKNGTYINSGDPTTSTGNVLTFTNASQYLTNHEEMFFFVSDTSTSGVAKTEINFGNGYFGTTAVSSAGTNASGNGIFEYDTPTGYTALSTKGLNL